eukprot:256134-Rhodomonas_salina.2
MPRDGLRATTLARGAPRRLPPRDGGVDGGAGLAAAGHGARLTARDAGAHQVRTVPVLLHREPHPRPAPPTSGTRALAHLPAGHPEPASQARYPYSHRHRQMTRGPFSNK